LSRANRITSTAKLCPQSRLLRPPAASTTPGALPDIEDAIWQLPDCFSDDLCQQKSTLVYQHIYDSYQTATQSTYAQAA
jgi:hypothetical protein